MLWFPLLQNRTPSATAASTPGPTHAPQSPELPLPPGAEAAWEGLRAQVRKPAGAHAVRRLCTWLAARNVSRLVFAGDSFSANLMLTVRAHFFDKPAPPREECQKRRRERSQGSDDCAAASACDGALHIERVAMNFVAESEGDTTHTLPPSDVELQRGVDKAVAAILPATPEAKHGSGKAEVVIWFGLWYLAFDYTHLGTALPRILREVPALVTGLRAAAAAHAQCGDGAACGQQLGDAAFIGPTYPWCGVRQKKIYCWKQGPVHMSALGGALRNATAGDAESRFADVFSISQAAGVRASTDGTHPGEELNAAVFQHVLAGFGYPADELS